MKDFPVGLIFYFISAWNMDYFLLLTVSISYFLLIFGLHLTFLVEVEAVLVVAKENVQGTDSFAHRNELNESQNMIVLCILCFCLGLSS